MSDQNSEISEDAGVEYIQEENDIRSNIEGENKEESMYGSKKIKPNKKKTTETAIGTTQEQKVVSEVNNNIEVKPKQIIKIKDFQNFTEKVNYIKPKNQQNFIDSYFQNNQFDPNEGQTKPPSDSQLKNSKNFIKKEEYLKKIKESNPNPNTSQNNQMNTISNYFQYYITVDLFDVIRYTDTKRIALYTESNGYNIYAKEYTIGNDPDSNADWFFPNRFIAYSYVNNYLRQKYALNQYGAYYEFYS